MRNYNELNHFNGIHKEVYKISRQYRSINEALRKAATENQRVLNHIISAHFARKDTAKLVEREKRRILKKHSS